GIGAYVGSYLREKGENLDVAVIARRSEEIKAEVTGEAGLKQKRWDTKWQCYAELVQNLGELHSIIREVIALRNRAPRPERDNVANEGEVMEKLSRATAALERARQFGSIARLAVAPNVLTVLTRFGDEWNRAHDPMQQGIVARWGWLVITDIARNDL